MKTKIVLLPLVVALEVPEACLMQIDEQLVKAGTEYVESMLHGKSFQPVPSDNDSERVHVQVAGRFTINIPDASSQQRRLTPAA